MTPLPATASDADLVALVDRWAALLEREEYAAAHALTGHAPGSGWTPALIREAIGRHGGRVTLAGVPAGRGPQVKEVTRWPAKADGTCGDLWYDLNVDGRGSDLTALFDLRPADGGVTLHLVDLGVR